MLVAAVQMNSQDDVSRNLERAAALVESAARAGAALVVLPENFAFMGEEAKKREIAERLDAEHAPSGYAHPDPTSKVGLRAGWGAGPILSTLCAAAAENRVYVIGGGMPERSSDLARPYNTSVLVGPDGAVAGLYRKIHLFDVSLPDGTSLRESAATMGGTDPVSVDVQGINVGMTICYDLRFPELFRRLVDRGVRVVTVPSAFTLTTGKDHWHVLLRARAIENQVFVIAAAQHGRHPKGRQTYGKALVCDPWGDVLAQAGEGEGFALARLDFEYQDRVRGALPSLLHRRWP